ncbi:Minor extracellular protease vpr, partial [Neolecta irregularis DAH-3]
FAQGSSPYLAQQGPYNYPNLLKTFLKVALLQHLPDMNIPWILLFASLHHRLANADLQDMQGNHDHPTLYQNHVQDFAIQDSLLSRRFKQSIHSGTQSSRKMKIPAYVVQLSSPLITITKEEHGLPTVHSFLTQLWSMTNNFEIRRIFSNSVFLGCSFHMEDHTLLEEIRALPVVVKIWPVRMIPFPEFPAYIPLQGVEPGTVLGEHKYAVHKKTGVEKLHKEGIMGKPRIIVGVVDTGVDYTLKALGGCLGPRCTIVAGEDLVGDDFDGTNTAHRGGPPVDVLGHGTHVAGIIVGKGHNFIGVAPSVSLAMWKVFGRTGGSSDDVIVEGLIAAKEAGASSLFRDIAELYWSEDFLSVAASKLADEGIFVSIANGNAGDLGLFAGTSPGTGLDVTAVGSAESPAWWGFPATIMTRNTESFSIDYFSNTRLSVNEPLEFYATSYDAEVQEDACKPLPDDTPDLSNRIVLSHRGNCSPYDQIANAQKKGAKVVLIYNNDKPLPFLYSFDVQAAMINASDGEKIIKALNKGSSKVFFSQARGPQSDSQLHFNENNLTGDLVSHFSSWGPTNELLPKPALIAPGGNILSSFPSKLGGYGIFSGTSMASPYIAGVAALLQSVHGVLNPSELKDILITTAIPAKFYDGVTLPPSPLPAPVIQQGGGLVEAYNALKWSSRIQPSILHLNDSNNFHGSPIIKIHNRGKKEATYLFSAKGASTVYTFPPDSIYPQKYPLKAESSFAVVSFPVDSVTIPGGGLAILQIDITLPHNLKTSRLPFYSGYIQIASTLGETFTVPYLGTTSNMKQVQIMEISERYPYLTTDTSDTGNKIAENMRFKIGTTAPTIVSKMAMGTPFLSMKLVHTSMITEKFLENGDFLSSKSGEEIEDFPIKYVPRSIDVADIETWDGNLASGNKIKAGSYKILISALKIFGNKHDRNDWEKWLSSTFVMEE